MSYWTAVRARARAQHRVLLAAAGGDSSSSALLVAAAEATGVFPLALPSGDTLLHGAAAVLDRPAQSIFYNRDTDPLMVPVLVGHEFAHLFEDHGDCRHCAADQIDPEASDEDVPLGVARVEGYSPEERREREANVYARELLLPSDTLRRWYLDEGLDASAIATRTGLPLGLVFHQLTYALLTPEPLPAERGAARPIPPLDKSQRAAATEPSGPVLVEAGPGTGKTRTLVARVGYLIGPERRESPEGILALTFSIKAAEEMRERITQAEGNAAIGIQVGTFHSFGLEMLRKHGHHLGYPPRPKVLDPASALFLLERMLPRLGLAHYQNLHEPAANLRDLLDAISRAKDELCTPDQYEYLARAMLDSAGPDQDKIETAERALEVARVYRLYQEQLDEEKTLDFGDLIFRTVDLLQRFPIVRATLGAQFRHILVDEYQDVNRASGVLLEELAKESNGRALWVVGDARQSVYRWRGASPANIRLLRDKFPQAKLFSLDVNYRSRNEVVDLVAGFAPRMKVDAGAPFTPWRADRGSGGQVLLEIASDGDSEAIHIGREIERRRREENIPYRSQAVLCRSHTQLARIASGLEQEGVPVLYLGDLFERTEIRDLLALLSLACTGDGRGLLRVGRFPEYAIPKADALRMIFAAKERGVRFPKALEQVSEVEGISEQGRVGLAKLGRHLEGLCYGTNAWGMLVEYLFNRSEYLRHLAADSSVAADQQRLALYQFLEFAHQNRRTADPDESGDPKRIFLDYVRRLEAFGEEKQLRNLPESAASIDAVRLLTIHGSKGLQFPVVYVPGLAAGQFPANRQGTPCPPPDGMLPLGTGDSHDEEEECLFFVAISRAEDVLCLSRPARRGGRNSNPSRLLTSLTAHLPCAPDGPVTWPADAPPESPVAPIPPPELRTFDVRDLDVYLRCPRQYMYERVLGLGGRRDDDAYIEVHKCVYDVLRWLQSEHAAGHVPDAEEALARLADVWTSHGPKDHPYEPMYRSAAESMVGEAMEHFAGAGAPGPLPTWEVTLTHGRVRFAPDHVIVQDADTDRAPTVYRLRTGRLAAKELETPIYGLYHRAFAEAFPGQDVNVHVLSLSTGESRPVILKAGPVTTRTDKYDGAIAGILRGEFPAAPSDRRCPRCPHYFVCPAAEDT